MSFINISRPTGEKKKFTPTEVKCWKCTEPNLKLKFGGRDSMGKIQYIDLYTNEIHQCNPKYLKTVTCKFCGQSGFKWIKSVNTASRVEMVDKFGKLHNCQNRGVSTYFEDLNHYFTNIVIWDNDTPDIKEKKMKKQRGFKARDPLVIDPEYLKQVEDWARHDFGNFKTCQCRTCIYRRDHPLERKFVIKKRV